MLSEARGTSASIFAGPARVADRKAGLPTAEVAHRVVSPAWVRRLMRATGRAAKWRPSAGRSISVRS